MKKFPGLFAFALLLTAGCWGAAAAQAYDLLGYPLGMSFDDFMARPIPESAGKKDWRILCSDGREMRDHMVGFIAADNEPEREAGALTCIFAEPDLIAPRWWKPATVNFAGRQMAWLFEFLSEPQGTAARRLIAITAMYRPDWERRNASIETIEPALVAAFGAGEAFEEKNTRGRIWRAAGQTSVFKSLKLLGTVKQAAFCIAIVDDSWLAELNRRLGPGRPRVSLNCLPKTAVTAAQ